LCEGSRFLFDLDVVARTGFFVVDQCPLLCGRQQGQQKELLAWLGWLPCWFFHGHLCRAEHHIVLLFAGIVSGLYRCAVAQPSLEQLQRWILSLLWVQVTLLQFLIHVVVPLP